MSYLRMQKGSEFDWKAYQKHTGFSDAELEAFKKDPKWGKFIPIASDPDFQDMTLVVEVVESRGCAQGMKPGDRLYLTNGCAMLDPTRSSGWCGHALHALHSFTLAAQNLMAQGVDPNDMHWEAFACADAGPTFGWGQVKMKCFVVNEKDSKK